MIRGDLHPTLPEAPFVVGVPQRPRQKPKWPVVIGSISLFISALSILDRSYSLGMAVQTGTLGIMDLAGAFVMAIFIAGGIMLIKRHYIGRTILLGWAYLCLFLYPLLMLAELGLLAHRVNEQERFILTGCLIVSVVIWCYAGFLAVWLTRGFAYRDLSGW